MSSVPPLLQSGEVGRPYDERVATVNHRRYLATVPASTTAAQAIGRTIPALGVRDTFGLIGSGNFELVEEMTRHGIAYHGARHETAAVAMADAYARVTHSLGVATVHQ